MATRKKAFSFPDIPQVKERPKTFIGEVRGLNPFQPAIAASNLKKRGGKLGKLG